MALMSTGAITCVVSGVTAACITAPSCMSRGSSTLACALSQNTCSCSETLAHSVTGGRAGLGASSVTLPRPPLLHLSQTRELTMRVLSNSRFEGLVGLGLLSVAVRRRFVGDSIVSSVTCTRSHLFNERLLQSTTEHTVHSLMRLQAGRGRAPH